MVKDQIAACCKKLKLSQSIAENYKTIEALEDETHYREVKRVNRLIKQAKFYTLKILDDYILVSLPNFLSME